MNCSSACETWYQPTRLDRRVALTLVGCVWLAVNLPAAEPIRLTDDGHLKRDPILIDQGRQVVYAVQASEDRLALMRLDVTNLADPTVESEPLHPDAGKTEFEPAFSADGRYYAFVQSRGNLSLALVIRDTRESTDAEVPPAGGFSGMRSPAFSPDATRVLFSYPEAGRQQLYSVNLKGADRRALTDSQGINNWPSFSPDGSSIAFASSRDGDYELYVMRSDGTQVRRLTERVGQDIRPRFSPDGKRIAYTRSEAGNYEVYVMNADGTRPLPVTQHPERDDFACWHPDGRRLVLVSERQGRCDLYLVDVPE